MASTAPLLSVSVSHAIAADDLHALNECLPFSLHSTYLWLNPTTQQLQQRTLLQIAAFHAALDVMGALLAEGVDVNAQSPEDGYTALHCACSNAKSSSTSRAIGVLIKSGAWREAQNSEGRTPCELLKLETPQCHGYTDDGDSELTRPEYMTDDFRMYRFKIEVCPRLSETHDWTNCPFQHPGEKARRRDPRQFRYHGVPCPDFRKGVCKRGDACTFAHGVFECWLHPSRYRTQLCKEGAACKRSVCFFAHAVGQLREPTMLLEDISQPSSPRGPLGPAEDSQETSRSCSPGPSQSEDSVQFNSSTESMRSVLQRMSSCRTIPTSADSSMCSTPVIDSGLAAAVQAEQIKRSLSNLTLSPDDLNHMAHAAALQACGVVNPAAAAMGFAPGAGGAWQQLQAAGGPDALALGQLASLGPLAAGLAGVGQVMDSQAAMLQAAYQQQQLAMLQSLAAAGMSQPLAMGLGQGFPGTGPSSAFPNGLGLPM